MNYKSIHKHYLWVALLVFFTLCLLATSIIHNLQLHQSHSAYTSSTFVPFNILLFFTLLILHSINFFLLISYLINKQWKRFVSLMGISIILFALMLIAVHIDSATLLYAS